MKKATRLIHTMGLPDKETGSVVQPIHTSTIFAMENPSSSEGFQYGRVGNPTRSILESTIANLEDAKHAAVFSSGSAALAALFATLKTGDHILCHTERYEGTTRLLNDIFKKFGISVEEVNMKKISEVKNKIRRDTKLILFETPTNPSLEIIDIQSICSLSNGGEIVTVVDNTIACPLVQQPLKLGASVVIESMTKFINGHSDVIGGLIATNDEQLFEAIRFLQITLGTTLSPMDCHMLLRSIKTLPLRVKEQQKSALRIVRFLKSTDAIETLHFPSEQKKNAAFFHRQMKGCGSIVSFSLNKEYNPEAFITNLNLIIIGHSFGGVESIIQQPSTMMDLSVESTITNNFFRLSIGLEDTKDIIADIKQALDQSRQIC